MAKSGMRRTWCSGKFGGAEGVTLFGSSRSLALLILFARSTTKDDLG